MFTYYVYDEVLDRYALMLVEQHPEEYAIVLDPDEFSALERWADDGQRIPPTAGLEGAALRAVLVEPIGRDPFEG